MPSYNTLSGLRWMTSKATAISVETEPDANRVSSKDIEPNGNEGRSSTTGDKVLYTEVQNIDNLKSGYKKLKNGVSAGVDGIQKSNFKETDFNKLHSDLRQQKYKPKANKRVGIPKADGGTRYLGIASTRDKIVQATIKNLLEPILEPTFSNYSYGFRPGIGCHQALFQIRHG